MEQSEFFSRALPYLCAQFVDMEKKLLTTEQRNRWFTRFQHLEFPLWCQTVDAYADEHDRRPTVQSLAACLPRGMAAKGGRSTCAHLWTRLYDGNQVCEHCGMHHRACQCSSCLCAKVDGHPGAETRDDGTRFCATCHYVLMEAV